MLVPFETLLDGVVATLTETVLPDLATPFARGQLYAAVDVLRNMRDRIEEKAALRDAERTSAVAALTKTADVLRAHGGGHAAVGRVDAAAHLDDVGALRAAIVAVLEELESLPIDVAAAARAPIAVHLAEQSMRDVAPLKPSMLSEISRG